MSIGVGIFLITVGAILAFAVRDRGGTLDLDAAGVVIMLAGAVGIWLSFHITNRRRRLPGPAVEGHRVVRSNPPAQYGAAPRTARSAPEPLAPGREVPIDSQAPVGGQVPVHREEPVSGEQVDGVTERHVDLDPAASGLHIPVPDRTAPVTSTPDTGLPGRDSGQPTESRARRLLRQLRRRH
ncbi:DUF6458 family protein [Kribbella sp. CA-294648]|uniref:DUF6458 family protein n=1 Tax=Kribbella sp. CA-294648 TaxID=3239948 RepID=UPI003D8D4F97